MAADYHFITHWRVLGAIEDAYAILNQPTELPRWWPSVYLAVQEVPAAEPGEPPIVHLYTKGWLPYTLRWSFQRTEQAPPKRLAIRAWGDFVGRGIWTLTQDGAVARITYDWKIRATKPLLRYCSWLIRPLFAANHRWAMRRGEESLQLELRRRQARTPAERAAIPAPPGPTWPHRARR